MKKWVEVKSYDDLLDWKYHIFSVVVFGMLIEHFYE